MHKKITAPTKMESRFLKAYKASNVTMRQVRMGHTPKLNLLHKHKKVM